jgi:hypothetical protein
MEWFKIGILATMGYMAAPFVIFGCLFLLACVVYFGAYVWDWCYKKYRKIFVRK